MQVICLRKINGDGGMVISCARGTFTIGICSSNARSKGHLERIRLSGIDCPEKVQAYGHKAKQAASTLVFGKEITLRTYGLDKYGRTLADVLLPDRTNVNHALAKEGWC
jgi:endonuclease YncB( thermonuclease family)